MPDLPVEEVKTCFIAMPISDMDGYPPGHFARVYEHVIKPACIAAGFKPLRADEVQSTNLIVADVITRIVDSELMIVDLSGRNPNVLYELGIRQAFNLPTVLLKDQATPRIFDVQGLRDVTYDETLRIDSVIKAQHALTQTIKHTHQAHLDGSDDYNSLIKLVKIKPAKLPEKVEISPDTGVILDVLHSISSRMVQIEAQVNEPIHTSKGHELVGEFVVHRKFGAGRVVGARGNGDKTEVQVIFKHGMQKNLLLKFANLKKISGDAYMRHTAVFEPLLPEVGLQDPKQDEYVEVDLPLDDSSIDNDPNQ